MTNNDGHKVGQLRPSRLSTPSLIPSRTSFGVRRFASTASDVESDKEGYAETARLTEEESEVTTEALAEEHLSASELKAELEEGLEPYASKTESMSEEVEERAAKKTIV